MMRFSAPSKWLLVRALCRMIVVDERWGGVREKEFHLCVARLHGGVAAKQSVLDGGVHTGIAKDIDSIFTGKNYDQLCTLEGQINAKINSGTATV